MTLKYFLAILQASPMYSTSDFARLSPVKYQDLLQASLSDSFHFPLDLFFVETRAPDFIMAVESTINAVVLAVVGNVDRREHAHAVTKMLSAFPVALSAPFPLKTAAPQGIITLQSLQVCDAPAASARFTSSAVYLL